MRRKSEHGSAMWPRQARKYARQNKTIGSLEGFLNLPSGPPFMANLIVSTASSSFPCRKRTLERADQTSGWSKANPQTCLRTTSASSILPTCWRTWLIAMYAVRQPGWVLTVLSKYSSAASLSPCIVELASWGAERSQS